MLFSPTVRALTAAVASSTKFVGVFAASAEDRSGPLRTASIAMAWAPTHSPMNVLISPT